MTKKVKVKLLNDGHYGDLDHVEFPVDVLAVVDNGLAEVPKGEIIRIGGRPEDWDGDSYNWIIRGDEPEAELVNQ